MPPAVDIGDWLAYCTYADTVFAANTANKSTESAASSRVTKHFSAGSLVSLMANGLVRFSNKQASPVPVESLHSVE
jgi:hypothetical protein